MCLANKRCCTNALKANKTHKTQETNLLIYKRNGEIDMTRIDKMAGMEIREMYNTLNEANKALDDWLFDLEDNESYANIHELYIDKLDNGKYFLYIRFDYIEKPTIKMGKFED